MTFKEKLQHKYALSEQGAKDMIHAFISATISNIVLMFPVGMLYLLVKNYMEGTLGRQGNPVRGRLSDLPGPDRSYNLYPV